MDPFRLNRLNEADFDSIISCSGGKRAVADHSRETDLNADYELHEAVVELKLFEEEGLEKQTRRQKIAAIFREFQPDCPVIVIDPQRLNEDAQRRYYRAMEGPLQTQVKKSAAQLQITRDKVGGDRIRVLLAINNGYTALNHEEFTRILVKCATNDTSKIDYVVSAGVYYYSDGFDSYFLSPCDVTQIQESAAPFTSFERLRECYQDEVIRQMTALVHGVTPADDAKLPVFDLQFDLDGIRYVKPTPPMGVPSTFYVNGRPRENSTGISRCPPVALTFPRLSYREWEKIRVSLMDPEELQTSFVDWQTFSEAESVAKSEVLKPFVPVEVTCEAFEAWCRDNHRRRDFAALCSFAAEVFNRRIQEIIAAATESNEARIIRPRQLALYTQEIGRDRANDLARLKFVSEVPGCEREELVFENQRLFHEYAVAVAGAYAIKLDVEAILYERDTTYGWS